MKMPAALQYFQGSLPNRKDPTATMSGLLEFSPPARGTLFSLFGILVFLAGVLTFHGLSSAEEIQNCSTVNARAVSLDGRWVLIRDDGRILTSACYSGGRDAADGLIAMSHCGSGAIDFLTPDGKIALTVDARDTGNFSEGLVAFENHDDLWGYMNKDGHIVIAPQFHKALPFTEGLAAVNVNDGWKYIDNGGNTVLVPQAEGQTVFSAGSFKSGAALIILFDPKTNDYTKGLINHSGKWVVTPTMNLTGETDNGLASFLDANGKVGFLDAVGRTVISPQFTGNSHLPFQESLAAVYVGTHSTSRAGFIDKQGHWVIAPKFENALHFCGGLAPVEINGLWGFIRTNGELAIPPKFETAESFNGGIAEVNEKGADGKIHPELINRNGDVLFKSTRQVQIVSVH